MTRKSKNRPDQTLRDRMVDRLVQMGFHTESPRQADLVKWRKPKDALERFRRQTEWGDKLCEAGKLPHWVDMSDPEMIDDETLMVTFEHACRKLPSGNNGSRRIKPIVQAAAFFGNLDVAPVWLLEFQVYNPQTNDYGVPDLAVVRAWVKENCAEPAHVVASSFIAFTNESDAMLCYLAFK